MNDIDFELPLIIVSVGIAIFLICFGLSFSDSSDKEKKIIKRIEKLEQTLQST